MAINWNEQPLGLESDRSLARQLGVNKSSVRAARVRRGIPAFDGSPEKGPDTMPSVPAPDTSAPSKYTVRDYVAALRAKSPNDRRALISQVDDHTPPVEEIPIDELLASRLKAAKRSKSAKNKHRKKITLPNEPIGLFCFGDLHLDDPHCSWDLLLDHVEQIEQANEKNGGVFGVCVGDVQNSWLKFLSFKYADHDLTAKDGWRLCEWLLEHVPFLALTLGNHDAWTVQHNGLCPYTLLGQKHGVTAVAKDELHLTLSFRDRPEVRPFVLQIRHTYRGKSIWNPVHGQHRHSHFSGERGHTILLAGHTHNWAMLQTEMPGDPPRVSYAVQLASYKKNDDYAIKCGFQEFQHGESCVIVLDPDAEGTGQILPFWDVRAGLAHLKMLREARGL